MCTLKNCRAGASTAFSFGSDDAYLGHYSLYAAASSGQPGAVAARMPNDIGLFDMSQYFWAEKGGVQEAQSMHVEFLTDQMVFRFIVRYDGQPSWSSALTPYQGTATTGTLSPFVVLASRA